MRLRHNGTEYEEVSQLKHIDRRGLIKNILSRYYIDLEGKIKFIWAYITSCFGAGFWNDNYPWTDNEKWNDG